jgi:hypothetical protein
MAWTFALSAECGPHRDSAESFKRHFDGAQWTLSDGVTSRCMNAMHIDESGNRWAIICPSGVSKGGVNSHQSARQLSEVGTLLYAVLRTAPEFRYAAVGAESDEFMYFHNIGTDLVTQPISGLVICNLIWERLERPDIFVPFAQGYRWVPYEGEGFNVGASSRT